LHWRLLCLHYGSRSCIWMESGVHRVSWTPRNLAEWIGIDGMDCFERKSRSRRKFDLGPMDFYVLLFGHLIWVPEWWFRVSVSDSSFCENWNAVML